MVRKSDVFLSLPDKGTVFCFKVSSSLKSGNLSLTSGVIVFVSVVSHASIELGKVNQPVRSCHPYREESNSVCLLPFYVEDRNLARR